MLPSHAFQGPARSWATSGTGRQMRAQQACAIATVRPASQPAVGMRKAGSGDSRAALAPAPLAAQVDTELSPEVADHFNIHKLPTLILFKGSQQAGHATARGAALPLGRTTPRPPVGASPPSAAAGLPTGLTRCPSLPLHHLQQVDRFEGLISGQDLDMRLRRLLR